MNAWVRLITSRLVAVLFLTPLGAAEAAPFHSAWGPQGIELSISPSDLKVMTDHAGGFYLAWLVTQGESRLQRLAGNAEVHTGWPADGVRFNTTSLQMYPDGLEGCLVVWHESWLRYVRIGPDGSAVPGWPAEGRTFDRQPYAVAPDGMGGLYYVGRILVDGIDRYRLFRLDAVGLPHAAWPADGVHISNEPDDLDFVHFGIAHAGPDAAYVTTSSSGTYCYPHGPCYPMGGTHHYYVTAAGVVWGNGGGGIYVPAWPLSMFPDGDSGAYLSFPFASLGVGRIRLDSYHEWSHDFRPPVDYPYGFNSLQVDRRGSLLGAWQGPNASLSDLDVFMGRLDRSGLPAGWPALGVQVELPGAQERPIAVPDDDGGAYLVYLDSPTGDYRDGSGVHAVHLDANGTSRWPESSGLPMGGGTHQWLHFGIPDGQGGAIIVYGDMGVLRAQKLVPDHATVADASALSATASADAAVIEWRCPSSQGRLQVQRSVAGAEWISVGEVVPDGQDVVRYTDRDVSEGRFGYRLALVGGVHLAQTEIWVDVPGSESARLRSWPNPAVSELRVAYSLAPNEAGALELFDTSGRRVRSLLVPNQAPAEAAIDVRSLPAGVYLLRWSTGSQVRSARIAIAR